MSETQRVGDLEIDQDLDFQRRSWAVQRVGWLVMAAVIAAGLSGLFGPGLLNRASVVGAGGESPRLEYSRFWRSQSVMTLRVELPPAAGDANGTVRVWLNRRYLEALRVHAVTPPPERVEAGPDRLTYVFAVPAAARPTAVTFDVEPRGFGALDGRLGVGVGPAVEFTQFIHP